MRYKLYEEKKSRRKSRLGGRIAVGRWSILGLGLISVRFLAAQPSASGQPYYGFRPMTCWETAPVTRVQDAWREAADSAMVRRVGIPILEGYDERNTNHAMVGTVRDSLRACVARLSPRALHGMDLLDAARNQLALNHDADAWTLTQQFLKEVDQAPKGTKTAPASVFAVDRPWALLMSVSDYAAATPPRWETADRLMKDLERLPQASAEIRLSAHLALMGVAREEGNDPRVMQESGAIYALWAANKKSMETDHALELTMATVSRTNVVLRQQGFVAAKRLVDSVYTIFAAQGRVIQWLEGLHFLYSDVYGKVAPPIQGTWWYQASDSGRIQRPTRGKVTVVYKAPVGRGSPFSDNYVSRYYQVFRTLLERYGARGLEIVTADETGRMFLDSVYSDPAAPAAEVERRRRYFLDVHAIPGIYTIYHVTDWRQLVDGHWLHKPSPRDVGYYFTVTLVDQRGRVIYGADQHNSNFLKELDQMITRALGT